jgi:hypothetical protein
VKISCIFRVILSAEEVQSSDLGRE